MLLAPKLLLAPVAASRERWVCGARGIGGGCWAAQRGRCDVAFDGQGRALVSAAVTQGGKLRGYVFGREVGPPGMVLLEHWYPGLGPSEALGIVRDGFDRIYPAGYITVNGETQARVTRIHG